jgi:hypothetical protein
MGPHFKSVNQAFATICDGLRSPAIYTASVAFRGYDELPLMAMDFD